MVVSPIEAYIRHAAGLRGIDPDTAVKVAKSEGGLKNAAQQSYAKKNGIREPSYGPFQLLVGGAGTGFPTGLGNKFIAQTGLDPSDPANVQAAIDFALDHAKGNGWGAWYGAKNSGIGKWAGIGGEGGGNDLTAFAPSSTETPAEAAVNAMAAGRLNNVRANQVQTVNYVPPPGSSQTPQFTPLVTIPHLQPQDKREEENAAPEAPAAPPAASPLSGEDLMRSWGLNDENVPSQPEPSQAPSSSEDQLIKAWGLDQNEEAPASGLASGEKRELNPIEKLIMGEPQTPKDDSVTGDAIRSIGSGLANGAIAVVGLPGTIQNAFDENFSKITGDVASLWGGKGIPAPPPSPLSIAGLHEVAAKASDGAIDYTPKKTGGKYLKTAAEFVPGALIGGGGIIPNLLKGAVIPGFASEAAGQATEGTSFEPYARVGAALISPLATEGALRGVEAAGNKLMSMTPSGAAANNLLAASGRSVDDISAEMARNPRLNAMDVDTNLQQMGMNLANQGGAPRATLNAAAEGRAAGAKDAVTDAYDAAAGSVPDVKAYLDGLKATTKANGNKAFGEALNGANPVDITPVLDSIDNVIAPGINGVVGKVSDLPQGPVEQALARVRAKLANSNEMLTDADRLHTVQSQLRREADTLAKSASGQDRLVADALRDVRQKIIGQIDKATGGKYRPAQKQYADDNAIQDAFDKGLEVFKGGTGKGSIENRPEYWDAWVKEATPAELDAAKVGTRVAVDQTISSVRNAAAKGEAIADVDFNVARLESLLGKSETQKLVQALKDEQNIARTNAKLFAGSQTAPRQAANKLTEVTQVTPGINLTTPMAIGGGYTVGGLPGAAAGAGLSLGRMGVQAALRARDVARNQLMAEALSGDVARFRDAVAPAIRGNKLLAPIRSAQSPLLQASTSVPVNLGIQHANELMRPGKQ